MKSHIVKMEGPSATGQEVSAKILQSVLSILIEGGKRAVKLRVHGKSVSRGAQPNWLDQISDFKVEIKSGSTILEIHQESLHEKCPGEFSQTDIFRDINPNDSSIDFFNHALNAAINGDEESDLYDKAILELFYEFKDVFDFGVDTITFNGSSGIFINKERIEKIKSLEDKIPASQAVKVAGKLDLIRHSDRTFILTSINESTNIKGIAEGISPTELQTYWGKNVVVSGTAYFKASGKPQRIEANKISLATDDDLVIWDDVPKPILGNVYIGEFKQYQNQRTGINAIIGKWPGDESDEMIRSALEKIS
jgi:hypothetical protein